jgi:hypothetical protein
MDNILDSPRKTLKSYQVFPPPFTKGMIGKPLAASRGPLGISSVTDMMPVGQTDLPSEISTEKKGIVRTVRVQNQCAVFTQSQMIVQDIAVAISQHLV